MKPIKYVAICEMDPDTFQKRINENLDDGLVFFGDTQFINNNFFQGMVKMLPIVQTPVPKEKK